MTKRIFGKLILSIVLLLAIWGLGAEYLVSHITDMARFFNETPEMTRETIDHACENYFVEQ